MTVVEFSNTGRSERRVLLTLRGGSVSSGFRDALFDAANRAGKTVNEYVIEAAAEKLRSTGRQIPDAFGNLSGHSQTLGRL